MPGISKKLSNNVKAHKKVSRMFACVDLLLR